MPLKLIQVLPHKKSFGQILSVAFTPQRNTPGFKIHRIFIPHLPLHLFTTFLGIHSSLLRPVLFSLRLPAPTSSSAFRSEPSGRLYLIAFHFAPLAESLTRLSARDPVPTRSTSEVHAYARVSDGDKEMDLLSSLVRYALT